MFGHMASSHTVCSALERISVCSRSYVSPAGARTCEWGCLRRNLCNPRSCTQPPSVDSHPFDLLRIDKDTKDDGALLCALGVFAVKSECSFEFDHLAAERDLLLASLQELDRSLWIQHA